jgi:hypothetical protein
MSGAGREPAPFVSTANTANKIRGAATRNIIDAPEGNNTEYDVCYSNLLPIC